MTCRVRIGTCAGAADAAFVRSVFAAHGIDVVVGAETTAIPGLTGGFLLPDIWVDDQDAEEAAALLRDIRERSAEGGPDDDPEHDDPEDQGGQGDGDDPTSRGIRALAMETVAQRIDRRRRTAVALLLACCITFGTAHLFTRAWLRGIALAGLEAFGLRMLVSGHALGGWLVAVAVACDLAGATWRIRAPIGSTLPVAQLRK